MWYLIPLAWIVVAPIQANDPVDPTQVDRSRVHTPSVDFPGLDHPWLPPLHIGSTSVPVVEPASLRLAPADTLFQVGHSHGLDDGEEAPVRGPFLSGLAWSLALGPVGGFIAAWRAGSSPYPVPPVRNPQLDRFGADYEEGYREGFGLGFDSRRTEASIVGSMIGSLVWTYAMIQFINLPDRSEFRGTIPPGPPTINLVPPAQGTVR